MKLLHYISICSPLLPILAFLIFKFNKNQKLKWVVFILLVVGVCVDIVSYKLAQKSENTLWLINFFTVVEFALLCYFFSALLKLKHSSKIIWLGFAVFLLTWGYFNVLKNSISSFDYRSQAIEFIFLLLFCIMFFFQKTRVSDTIFIYNTYQFWLVSALLIYCAGTFFSFLIPMSSDEKKTDILVFEYISRVGSIVKSILITVAFCLNPANLSKNQPNPNSIYYIKDLKE